MKKKSIVIKGTIFQGLLDITKIPEGVVLEIKDYDMQEEGDGKDDVGEYKILKYYYSKPIKKGE